MTAEEIILAVAKAVELNRGVDVVYVHDAEGAPFAAIVTIDWLQHVGPAGVRPGEQMYRHDHIEPGMF